RARTKNTENRIEYENTGHSSIRRTSQILRVGQLVANRSSGKVFHADHLPVQRNKSAHQRNEHQQHKQQQQKCSASLDVCPGRALHLSPTIPRCSRHLCRHPDDRFYNALFAFTCARWKHCSAKATSGSPRRSPLSLRETRRGARKTDSASQKRTPRRSAARPQTT